jgi:hypothetical protein
MGGGPGARARKQQGRRSDPTAPSHLGSASRGGKPRVESPLPGAVTIGTSGLAVGSATESRALHSPSIPKTVNGV